MIILVADTREEIFNANIDSYTVGHIATGAALQSGKVMEIVETPVVRNCWLCGQKMLDGYMAKYIDGRLRNVCEDRDECDDECFMSGKGEFEMEDTPSLNPAWWTYR